MHYVMQVAMQISLVNILFLISMLYLCLGSWAPFGVYWWLGIWAALVFRYAGCIGVEISVVYWCLGSQAFWTQLSVAAHSQDIFPPNLVLSSPQGFPPQSVVGVCSAVGTIPSTV